MALIWKIYVSFKNGKNYLCIIFHNDVKKLFLFFTSAIICQVKKKKEMAGLSRTLSTTFLVENYRTTSVGFKDL